MTLSNLLPVDAEELAANVVAGFHREQHGITPQTTRARVVDDLLVVRLENAFTSIECDLIQTEQGRKLVQSSRRELRAMTRRTVEKRLAEALGVKITRSFCDLDVRNGMVIEVYVLEA